MAIIISIIECSWLGGYNGYKDSLLVATGALIIACHMTWSSLIITAHYLSCQRTWVYTPRVQSDETDMCSCVSVVREWRVIHDLLEVTHIIMVVEYTPWHSTRTGHYNRSYWVTAHVQGITIGRTITISGKTTCFISYSLELRTVPWSSLWSGSWHSFLVGTYSRIS